MRSCQYEECAADLTGYPPASKYCSLTHAALAKHGQEADYARRNRGPINRRRRNREARRARQESGFEVPEPPQEELSDGRSRPPLIDGVSRSGEKPYTGSHDPDDVDDLPWIATRNDRIVAFPATRAEPRSYDHLGRPARRGGPVRAEVEFGELVNPAADGMMYVRSPAAGQALVAAQKQGSRFGPKLESPVQVSSGMLASPPPSMVKAENLARVQERQASDHMRQQAGYASWRR